MRTTQHDLFLPPIDAATSPKLIGQKAIPRFPSTRYQGSKRKILPELAAAFEQLQFRTALDLYSGTGIVALLLRYLGVRVDTNDYQRFNQLTADLFLHLTNVEISNIPYKDEMKDLLLLEPLSAGRTVLHSYKDIYFTDAENSEIDRFAQNVVSIPHLRRLLYTYAVGQALTKKRPYNLFHRANISMRQRDVKRSFGNAVTWETSILDHAVKAINELRQFPFAGSASLGNAFCENTTDLSRLPNNYDLIYLDPPYLNSKGVGVDYSDFYNFLEGLCDYSLFDKGDNNYPHRPISKKKSNWLQKDSALVELSAVVEKWSSSIIFLSYRSDGLPTLDQATEVLSSCGRRVEVHSCGEYKYALSRTNTNEEIFLISFPSAVNQL